MKNKLLKKLAIFALCSLVTLGGVACEKEEKNSGETEKEPPKSEQTLPTPSPSGSTLPALDSWHEEKSGYKFCGYYKDAAFTEAVTEKLTESEAKNYYPKYQIDKAQQIACVPTNFEHTIYSGDFVSAVQLYLYEICAIWDINAGTRNPEYEKYGIPYPYLQMLFNDVEPGYYALLDTSETIPHDYREYNIPHYQQFGDFEGLKTYCYRENTWKAHIGTPTEYVDPANSEIIWSFSVVDEKFAVVYGFSSGIRDDNKYIESATIPSTIGGYPVKEVTIAPFNPVDSYSYFPQVGTLNVPSSVENVTLYGDKLLRCTSEEKYAVEQLNIAEGVQTVRMDSLFAKSVALPASAHYVDINVNMSMSDYEKFRYEQNVTVAKDGHYYTQDGCLYSVEGDLVYQFSGRGNLDLHIAEGTKRVLPLSFTGIAKNIYMPESLEYFDWQAFYYSARPWSSDQQQMRDMPIFIIDGQKYAEVFACETVFDLGYRPFPVVLFKNTIDMRAVYEKALADLVEFLKEVGDAESVANIEENKELLISTLTADSGLTGYKSYSFGTMEWHACRVVDGVLYRNIASENNGDYLATYTPVSYLDVTITQETDLSIDGPLSRYYAN